MYTATNSSSTPVRTSTFGVGSTNHQHQPSTKINYNSYQTMNDGNMSPRNANGTYFNYVPSPTSTHARTTTPSRKYTSNYNNSSDDFNTNRYQTTPYRSYAGGNDVFRANNSSVGNTRARSYDDLANEQNPSYRFRSSVYSSGSRMGIDDEMNNRSHAQQQQQHHIRRDDCDDDLIVKSTDLSASIEQEMVELVRAASRKYDLSNQRELAGFLKRAADRTFSSCWHCIVGRQFSSYVTHEMNGFIYLTKGPLSILLFKSGS